MRKFFAMIITIFVISIVSVMPSNAGKLTVVYIGAKDCVDCARYESSTENSFSALVKSKGGTYRQVKVETLRNLHKKSEYPQDLKWVVEAAGLRAGTPTFVVLDGKNVIMKKIGVPALKGDIYPLFQ